MQYYLLHKIFILIFWKVNILWMLVSKTNYNVWLKKKVVFFFFFHRPTNELPCTPPSESQKKVYSILVSRIQEEPLKGMIGPDYVTGSNLPSHSDVHISCLTGLRIQVQFQRAKVTHLGVSTEYQWGYHKSKVHTIMYKEEYFPYCHSSRSWR